MPRYIYSVTVRWTNSHRGPQRYEHRGEANSTVSAINQMLRYLLTRRETKDQKRDCRAIREHVNVEAIRVRPIGQHPDSMVREDAL